MYTCKICGESFENIRSRFRRHLKKKHGLRKYDYALKYEPEWIEKGLTQNQLEGGLTVAERKQKKLESGEISAVECKLCGKLFQFLGVHVKRAHGISIKEYKKMFPEAEVASKELRELHSKVAKANLDKFVEMVKRNWSDPEFREKKRKEASVQLSKRNRQYWKNPEYRKRQSERQSKLAIQMHKEGKCYYRTNKIEIELNGKLFVFKSAWELAFALYLIDKGIDFEYETLIIEYERDGKKKRYISDFITKDAIYEVKGWVKDKKKIELTFQAMKEKGFNPILVDKVYFKENNINPYLRKARKIYKEYRGGKE